MQENLNVDNKDEVFVLISSLNHYIYCPRRCALIYIEGVYVQNVFTLEGTLLHQNVDESCCKATNDIRIVSALPLYSEKYGLSGKADIIELHKNSESTEIPYPIEYKRGKKKKYYNDDVQLCAQALCLEEMFEVQISQGAIYHISSKRRRNVEFTSNLRDLTLSTIYNVRQLICSGLTPKPELKPQCNGCSLREICLPEIADAGFIRKFCNNLFDTTE